MKKIAKKLSAMLLTLALVLTMMPFAAVDSFAADGEKVFGIAINGKDVGVDVTKQMLEENAIGAQVFPFVAGQGKQWKYVVADGASYEYVITDALMLDSLDEIADAAINWNDENGEEAGKFDLYIPDFSTSVEQFKLVDQDGKTITGAFTDEAITSAEAVAIEGAADVTPVIAYKYAMYNTYDEAVAAVQDGSWINSATEEVRPFVGGNLSKETFVKSEGKVNPKGINFTGKFSVVSGNPDYMLNIKNVTIELPAEPEKASVNLKVGQTQQLGSTVYTDPEVRYLNGMWECDDADVATVDEYGNIVAVGAGTCKVSLVSYAEESTEVQGVIGEWTVTVTKPAPAKPTGLKAKNVKKRKASLTWKAASNAEGYEIYRSTKKKKGFKKVATVSKTSYKSKKLKKGKTYYFKIRSYNVQNGVKVYSAFTSAKKVKIKK